MSDFAARVKIEFSFMGKTEKMDAYINYAGDGGKSGSVYGIDHRVQEFFENAYDAGLQRYQENTRTYFEKQELKETEKREREELIRLKSKYEK